jgi:hypothetical protein
MEGWLVRSPKEEERQGRGVSNTKLKVVADTSQVAAAIRRS